MFQRKNNRLDNYDYSTDGYYYVTICLVKGKFGEIMDDEIILNQTGDFAKDSWESLPEKFQEIQLDEYVIMPDHFHGILILNNSSKIGRVNISSVIKTFKLSVLKKLHIRGLHTIKWQKSFYDRIIRTEHELFNVRNYVRHNVLKEYIKERSYRNRIF